MPPVTGITILYDASCGICTRTRDWIAQQEPLVRIRLLASDSSDARIEFAARLADVGGKRRAIYVAMEIDNHRLKPGQANAALTLTNREREIVTLIALGRDTGEIAAELHVSPETVRSHVRNAMAKLDVHTRAQLVAVVLCHDDALHEAMLKSQIPPSGD